MTITCPQLGNAGRLGNQLWQIASTIGIARREGEDFAFPAWAYQDVFGVPDEKFSNWVPDGIPVEEYLPKYSPMDPRAYPYLQDYSLWERDRYAILNMLEPYQYAYEKLEEGYSSYREMMLLPEPRVALHIRRGDNATAHLRNEQGHHPLRPIEYYVEALEYYRTENGNLNLVIFSDDIPWCENAFSDWGAVFFKGGAARPKEHEPEYRTAPVEDWVDLVAMTRCQQFILSNSTYSYWGAMLSGAEGADITYPWPWFGPKLNYIDASLMFPHDWKRLNHAS